MLVLTFTLITVYANTLPTDFGVLDSAETQHGDRDVLRGPYPREREL
jgi:hypothetical protein